jgi:hypothetical protein
LAKGGRGLSFKPKRDALTRVRHDLRSLVHSVVGYSDLLASERYGVLSPDQVRFVNHVRSAAEHLQELVDSCIEFSRPALEPQTLELPALQLGQVLRRVRNGLTARELACDLTIAPELETREFVLDLGALERALLGLSLVVTRDATLACSLRARQFCGQVVIDLSASDVQEPVLRLLTPDELEDDIGNRDFVRLKLGEVLLGRQGIGVRLTSTLDRIELTLRCP